MGFSTGSTRSPALLLSPGWRHRCLCIKYCLFRKTTIWRETWPWQGVNRSAWLTKSHVPPARKPWKSFCACSAEYWDCVWELSFAAVWSPFTTVYIQVGNICGSSLGKTVFRTYRGILSLHLFSLEHKAQESSEKEMHMQSINTTIPDDAMRLQSTCCCPHWFACWGNPYSTSVMQLFLQRQLKSKCRQSSICPQQSLPSIFHRSSQLSTYSTCYLHLKLLINQTQRIRTFDSARKHNLCLELVLVLVIIKSHNYTASQSEEKVSFYCQVLVSAQILCP